MAILYDFCFRSTDVKDKMDFRNQYSNFCIVFCLLFLNICKAHKDGAYMHDRSDGFNERKNWMSKIRNQVKLNELALPGTHNSATFTTLSVATVERLIKFDLLGLWSALLGLLKGSSSDFWKTQVLNFEEQLNYGIRAFDIRIVHINDSFSLYHGPVNLNLKFDDFLNAITSFLQNHKTDTVLFRLKEENEKTTGTNLSSTLRSYLRKFRKFHFLPNLNYIKLGEARGKFVILSDHKQFHRQGLIYSSFNIQDVIMNNIEELHSKWISILNQLKIARNGDPYMFFINYLSGSADGLISMLRVKPYFVASGHVAPETNATRKEFVGERENFKYFPKVDGCNEKKCRIMYEGTNILARDEIASFNKNLAIQRRTVGIIMADFPGDSLIKTIIKNNEKLLNDIVNKDSDWTEDFSDSSAQPQVSDYDYDGNSKRYAPSQVPEPFTDDGYCDA